MARLNRAARLAKRAMYAKKAAEKAARKEAAKKRRAEESLLIRAWGKARSALERGYDRPVNRQAAKDLSYRETESN